VLLWCFVAVLLCCCAVVHVRMRTSNTLPNPLNTKPTQRHVVLPFDDLGAGTVEGPQRRAPGAARRLAVLAAGRRAGRRGRSAHVGVSVVCSAVCCVFGSIGLPFLIFRPIAFPFTHSFLPLPLISSAFSGEQSPTLPKRACGTCVFCCCVCCSFVFFGKLLTPPPRAQLPRRQG
jgi:hypothetical protein